MSDPTNEELDENATFSLANAFMNQFVMADLGEQKDRDTIIPSANPDHEVRFINRDDNSGMEVYIDNEFLGEVDYADPDCTPKLIVLTRSIFGE